MRFLDRLFGWDQRPGKNAVPLPDEATMKRLLEEAKNKNKEALAVLTGLADRQVRDATLIRQIITDMLNRANHKTPSTVNGKPAK